MSQVSEPYGESMRWQAASPQNRRPTRKRILMNKELLSGRERHEQDEKSSSLPRKPFKKPLREKNGRKPLFSPSVREKPCPDAHTEGSTKLRLLLL